MAIPPRSRFVPDPVIMYPHIKYEYSAYMAEAIRHKGLQGRMTGGVIVATLLQTALPGCAERRLHYDSDCRLIIPAGRMHSPLRRRPSGTNLPLHHLQALALPRRRSSRL